MKPTKLYVGNIPFSATDKEIRAFFDPIHINDVYLVKGPDGEPRGFAFVTITDKKDAAWAVAELNGCDLGGRKAVVSEAIEKKDKNKKQDKQRQRP